MIAQPDGRVVGDPDHPANFRPPVQQGCGAGRKHPGRRAPAAPGDRRAARAGWDEALDLVAATFKDTIAQHGPDSVAFYVSGQCLTEDYYVANKLMKGFARQRKHRHELAALHGLVRRGPCACHGGGYRARHRTRTWRKATLSCWSAATWPGATPVLFQRLQAARARRAPGSWRSIRGGRATCEDADLHLPLAPAATWPYSRLAGLPECQGLRRA